MEDRVSFADVLKARIAISKFLRPTPLHSYPGLDRTVGTRVLVKHENYQPIGVFKVRGGLNLISQLTPEARSRGVITASTGNHGQSIAHASSLFGVRAVIMVPDRANRVKVESMRGLGAEVIHFGRDFDECREHCESEAEKSGARFVSTGDEPLLIAGVATCALEILEEAPDVELIFVPVGGGSCAAGACIVAKTLNPRIRVIGVQSSRANAAYLTWKNRERTESRMETIAEGVATRAPFMLPQSILWRHLDDFLLVEDADMMRCVGLYLEKARTLAEPAGAASLAAAIQQKDEIQGKQIAVILSGGNISPEQLRQAL